MVRTAPENAGCDGARPIVSGIIVLDKPTGPTSRDLVNRVAKLLPRVKVGHAGTLDPLASGILVVCVGAATRLTEIVQHLGKSYRTGIRLGARSDTHDAQGAIEAEKSPRIPSALEMQEALTPLVGHVMQAPPEYSALRIKGRRAYDLARAGQAVELAPRAVQIDRIEVLSYDWPLVELEIDCAKGTYIRSIARDLGEALGCGGYVQTLDRTRIGPFTRAQAVNPSALAAGTIDAMIRPPTEAIAHLSQLVIDNAAVASVVQGRAIEIPASEIERLCERPGDRRAVALLDQEGRLIALAEPDFEQQLLLPRKVLGGASGDPPRASIVESGK